MSTDNTWHFLFSSWLDSIRRLSGLTLHKLIIHYWALMKLFCCCLRISGCFDISGQWGHSIPALHQSEVKTIYRKLLTGRTIINFWCFITRNLSSSEYVALTRWHNFLMWMWLYFLPFFLVYLVMRHIIALITDRVLQNRNFAASFNKN